MRQGHVANIRRGVMPFALLAPVLVLLITTATAQPRRSSTDILKRFCSGDAATLCGDVDPARGPMKACFQRNMAQLSPACRHAIKRYKT